MKKFTKGIWICSYNKTNLEIIIESNIFDWFTIDLEHSALSVNECFDLVSFIKAHKKECFVRMNDLNHSSIKKILDFGVDGLILPLVKNKEDLSSIIDSVYYPPKGSRGTGLFRAQRHGNKFKEYVDYEIHKTKIILQIEHIEAINNLECFLENDDVYGLLIGPYDLSASLGMPGNFESNEFIHAIDRFEKLCLESKKNIGFHLPHPNIEKYKSLKDKGYNFIGYSTDIILFQEQINLISKDLKQFD